MRQKACFGRPLSATTSSTSAAIRACSASQSCLTAAARSTASRRAGTPRRPPSRTRAPPTRTGCGPRCRRRTGPPGEQGVLGLLLERRVDALDDLHLAAGDRHVGVGQPLVGDGDADRPDLAFLPEHRHRLVPVVVVAPGPRPGVQEQDVDVVGAQPAQAGLALGADPSGREGVADRRARRVAPTRRSAGRTLVADHQVVTGHRPRARQTPDEALDVAVAVVGGRVDEVGAGIDPGPQGGERLLVVLDTPDVARELPRRRARPRRPRSPSTRAAANSPAHYSASGVEDDPEVVLGGPGIRRCRCGGWAGRRAPRAATNARPRRASGATTWRTGGRPILDAGRPARTAPAPASARGDRSRIISLPAAVSLRHSSMASP